MQNQIIQAAEFFYFVDNDKEEYEVFCEKISFLIEYAQEEKDLNLHMGKVEVLIKDEPPLLQKRVKDFVEVFSDWVGEFKCVENFDQFGGYPPPFYLLDIKYFFALLYHSGKKLNEFLR